MRAAIYTRVSSDQRSGRSVTEQEADCRAICAREGWQVVRVLVDNDRSASRYATKDRPAFAELEALVGGGGCDVVVAWEPSRLQRDLAVFVRLRDLCREAGVRWSYSGRTFDLSDDRDQFSTGLDALLAEQESGRTQRRVLRATRANAQRGRPHGRLPYGYARTYDSTTGELVAQVEHPEQGPILREVASRFLAGESFYAIARDLEQRGVPGPTGGAWHPTNLRRLLASPTYHGERVYRGKVVGQATWPSLFDDRTWWAVQQRLADPKRRTNRERERAHLLTGVAVCGVCGGRLTVLRQRGVQRYTCHAAQHVARQVADVDEVVEAAIVARLSRPLTASELLSDDRSSDQSVAEAMQVVRSLRARLDEVVEAITSGDLSPVAGGRVETNLLREIGEAEARARSVALPEVVRSLVSGDVAARWSALSDTEKRTAIRAVMAVRIMPTGRGRRTFDPASVAIEWQA